MITRSINSHYITSSLIRNHFFAYAKSKAKFTVSAGPLIDSLGSILQTPEENIEEFNRFFCISIYPGES